MSLATAIRDRDVARLPGIDPHLTSVEATDRRVRQPLVLVPRRNHLHLGRQVEPELQRMHRPLRHLAMQDPAPCRHPLHVARLQDAVRSRVIAMLERADIPVQRMNTLKDIVEDPHLAAIGYFKQIEHPTEGRIKSMAVPSEWSESKPEYRRHAPRLGEHTREVLLEAGYDDRAIDRLIESGAAGTLR